MDKKRLSESLIELQDALQNSTSISKADRQRLERLHAIIESKLEQEEPVEEEDETLVEELVDELVETIQEFEVSYPQITLALGRLMTILSQSGI